MSRNLDDSSIPITVYKLGGSLLTDPRLIAKCGSLIEREDGRALIVGGGGRTADIVREWDRAFSLTAVAAHRLAIRAMALNEELLLHLWPEASAAVDRDSAEAAWQDGRSVILRTDTFLSSEQSVRDDSLPATWEVTSDSIAAWVAIHWPASRLVLLKSTGPPPGCREAQDSGAIDGYFPRLLPALKEVCWCNLRDEQPGPILWQPADHPPAGRDV